MTERYGQPAKSIADSEGAQGYWFADQVVAGRTMADGGSAGVGNRLPTGCAIQ